MFFYTFCAAVPVLLTVLFDEVVGFLCENLLETLRSFQFKDLNSHFKVADKDNEKITNNLLELEQAKMNQCSFGFNRLKLCPT